MNVPLIIAANTPIGRIIMKLDPLTELSRDANFVPIIVSIDGRSYRVAVPFRRQSYVINVIELFD